MNYLKQINEFNQVAEALSFTPNTRAVYTGLLARNNDLRWVATFKLSNIALAAKTGVHRNKIA